MFNMRFIVAVFAFIAGLGFSLPLYATPPEQVIEIKNYHFVPQDLTVAPGTKITWINRDEAPHTVVQKEKNFRSSAMDTGDSYSFTITEPGRYAYFCSLHPQMVATITVRAGQ